MAHSRGNSRTIEEGFPLMSLPVNIVKIVVDFCIIFQFEKILNCSFKVTL